MWNVQFQFLLVTTPWLEQCKFTNLIFLIKKFFCHIEEFILHFISESVSPCQQVRLFVQNRPILNLPASVNLNTQLSFITSMTNQSSIIQSQYSTIYFFHQVHHNDSSIICIKAVLRDIYHFGKMICSIYHSFIT